MEPIALDLVPASLCDYPFVLGVLGGYYGFHVLGIRLHWQAARPHESCEVGGCLALEGGARRSTVASDMGAGSRMGAMDTIDLMLLADLTQHKRFHS